MDYRRIHDNIIDQAKNRVPIGYTENHHIIPKCIGGCNSKSNLVRLTAKEHFIIHKLLVEIYPEQPRLIYAAFMMANTKSNKRNYRIGSNEYKRLKEAHSSQRSADQTKLMEDPVVRAKLSASMIGKNVGNIITDEMKVHLRNKTNESWRDPIRIAKSSAALKKMWQDPVHRAKHIGLKEIHNPITKKVRRVKGDELVRLMAEGWLKGKGTPGWNKGMKIGPYNKN